MIFAGDIAIPNTNFVLEIPDELKSKDWFINLEGSLINSEEFPQAINQIKVFNSVDSIEKLNRFLRIRAFSIANNHIQDCHSINETMRNLDKLGINYVGGGKNIEEASKALEISDRLSALTILSFGWDVINCPVAKKNSGGVNPYERNHVIKSVRDALKHSDKVICYFHWGYELEAYPLPYDRELSHTLIDMGVYAVIGCHAHRVQQIEVYKGRPIVYGLGNFIFPQGKYWNGRLKFPLFTKTEMAFEITEQDEWIAHWFVYDIENCKIYYKTSDRISNSEFDFEGKAEYADLDSHSYDVFFKSNRYHKKMLPVYKSNDGEIIYSIKNKFVKARGKIIALLLKLNLIKSK